LILANCGIKTRHYAIDKKQQTVISNAAMAAGAVRNAAERRTPTQRGRIADGGDDAAGP
jgi:hypothetical protein